MTEEDEEHARLYCHGNTKHETGKMVFHKPWQGAHLGGAGGGGGGVFLKPAAL